MIANTGTSGLNTLMTFKNNFDRRLARNDTGVAGLNLGQRVNSMTQWVSLPILLFCDFTCILNIFILQ